MIDLVGTEVEERCQQQDVGMEPAEDVGNLVGRRCRAIDRAEDLLQEGQARAGPEQGHPGGGRRKRRSLRHRTSAELRGVVPAWIEVAPVIEGCADAGRERVPQPVAAGWKDLDGD